MAKKNEPKKKKIMECDAFSIIYLLASWLAFVANGIYLMYENPSVEYTFFPIGFLLITLLSSMGISYLISSKIDKSYGGKK